MSRFDTHVRRAHLSALTACAVVLVACLVACGDDEVVVPERDGLGGKVTGRVVGASGPISTTIRLESIERDAGIDSSSPRSLLVTHTDAEGRYSIDVPAGRYRVGTDAGWSNVGSSDDGTSLYWRRDQPSNFGEYGDTLDVSVGSVIDSIDFTLGSLTVELSVGEAWVGDDLWVSLDRENTESTPQDYWVRFLIERFVPPAVILDFQEIPPGRFRIEVSDSGRGHGRELGGVSVWLPSSITRPGGDIVVVAPGASATYTGTFAPEILGVDGVVDGAWKSFGGEPPNISAFSADSLYLANQNCDEAGSFAFNLSAREPFRLAVSGDGGVSWFGGPTFEEATLFQPPPSGPISGLRFVDSAIELVPAGIPSPSEFRLTVFDESGRRVHATTVDWPDERAVVRFLSPGRYRFLAAPVYLFTDEWLPQYYDRAFDLEQAKPIELLGEGQIATIDIGFDRGGILAGTIRGPEGDLIRDAYIYVASAEEPKLLANGLFFSGGRYRIPGVAPGRYRVGAREYAYEVPAHNGAGVERVVRWYSGATRWEDSTPVTITGTDSIGGLDIRLPWIDEE